MLEQYRILVRNGSTEGIGQYEITRRGTRREITRFVERYVTPAGIFLPEEWENRVMTAIETAGEIEILESIKEYCRIHCAWLHKEKEIEEYAMECLCSRAYRAWKDFENTETIIWM